MSTNDNSLLHILGNSVDTFRKVERSLYARGKSIPDPGPYKYDADAENAKRALMSQVAFYSEEGVTFDFDGEYLCGTCLYRIETSTGVLDRCHIVEGVTKMDVGSCQFYRKGDSQINKSPLVMAELYSQVEAGYAERPEAKGFGCYPRCGHASVAEGPDDEGRSVWCNQFGVHVTPKACCSFEGGKDLVLPNT